MKIRSGFVSNSSSTSFLMKLRKGFVSNSSSSSFICDICGNEASGFDMCLSDAEMYQCENGHTFCTNEALNEEELLEIDDFDNYEVPAKYCPCCQFSEVSDKDIVAYFLKEQGKTRKEIGKMWKERFATYDAFSDHVRQ